MRGPGPFFASVHPEFHNSRAYSYGAKFGMFRGRDCSYLLLGKDSSQWLTTSTKRVSSSPATGAFMNYSILRYFGLLAPIWLAVGVAYSGSIYPGYSHFDQAMSELHAVGSPIEHIAPFVNHYPLSVLFTGFGVFVLFSFKSTAARISGILIILHGLATLTAGYFPCDAGCSREGSSTSQILHGISGLFILLTLLIAPAIWAFVSPSELDSRWFGWFSGGVVVVQLLLTAYSFSAFETGEGVGFYQRLIYSVPLLWIFVFAAILKGHKADIS